MNTEHEGVDRSAEESRAGRPSADGDHVPPTASPDAPQRPAPDDATAPLPATEATPAATPGAAPEAADAAGPPAPGPDSAAAPAPPAAPPAAPGSTAPAETWQRHPAPSAQQPTGGWGPPPASPTPPPGTPGASSGDTPPPVPPSGHAHGPNDPGPGGPGPGGPGYGGPGYGGPGYGGPGGHGPAQPWGAPLPPPPAPRKRRGPLIAAALVGALLIGGVGGGVGYWAAERTTHSSSETVESPARDGRQALNRPPDSVAGIADEALPSVVTIQVNGGSDSQGGGTGTGFVFDKQGHILTNNHVVASAADGAELNVVFSDGKQYDAEVVGRAEGYDIAVIKLTDPEGVTLTPLPLGDSDAVAVGDSTIAIGAPFGLSGTVTTGIVSALNRPVASSDAQGSSASYMSALQTDASINPGNSGGPLLNADGEVIGVNSAIQSTGGGPMEGPAGSIGLGFAIPVDQAKRVAQTLIETGRPVYPIIGATVDMRQGNDGAVISERGEGDSEALTPGGPADEAGLRPGDVITKFDGAPIDSGPTLISEIWTHTPGEKVTLTYERDGKQNQIELTLGERVGDG
ncbi:hypothetical protein GCM10023347_05330 [Streptomyces chumphonensis]|uniref:S1C family serine protease n=1 Tax=Streptomyces chumphonensis TaxID=1214925 RepID=UPI002963E89B|nr:trypsin-like peptidase domain-containing protein [Streptomyces chumphonensis]